MFPTNRKLQTRHLCRACKWIRTFHRGHRKACDSQCTQVDPHAQSKARQVPLKPILPHSQLPSSSHCADQEPDHGVPTLGAWENPASCQINLFRAFPVFLCAALLRCFQHIRGVPHQHQPGQALLHCLNICFSENSHSLTLRTSLPVLPPGAFSSQQRTQGFTGGCHSRQRLWEKGFPWVAMPRRRREGEVLPNLPWINRKMKAQNIPYSAGTCTPNPNSNHVLFSLLLPCLGISGIQETTVAVLYHFQVHSTLPEPHGEKYLENQRSPCWNPSQFIGACI